MNAAASLELTALALTIAAAATAITAARTGRHHLSWLALGIGAQRHRVRRARRHPRDRLTPPGAKLAASPSREEDRHGQTQATQTASLLTRQPQHPAPIRRVP